MRVRREVPLVQLVVRFQRDLLIVAGISIGATLLNAATGWGAGLEATALPMAAGGLVLAGSLTVRLFVAYRRWWAARQCWAEAAAASRTFGRQVLTHARPAKKTKAAAEAVGVWQRSAVLRQIAWAQALRCHLRGLTPHEVLRPLLDDEERVWLRGEQHIPAGVLHLQGRALVAARDEGLVDDAAVSALDGSLAALDRVQAACDALQDTPVPRGWSALEGRAWLVWCGLLPLVMVTTSGWLTLVFGPLVALVVFSLDAVADELEQPFAPGGEGVPLDALARSIEIDLLQQLDETDLPPRITPDGGTLL